MIRSSTKKRLASLDPGKIKNYSFGNGVIHLAVEDHPYTLCGRRIPKNAGGYADGRIQCLYCLLAVQYVGADRTPLRFMDYTGLLQTGDKK